MNRRDAIKVGILGGGGMAIVAAGLAQPSVAQSEFLQGEGFAYAAFDRLPKTDVKVPGGLIRTAFAPGPLAMPKSAIFNWIRTSANAVSTYYGRFPVRNFRLLIVPVGGSRVGGGTTWGYAGAATRVLLGQTAEADILPVDWVMTHEMVHLALPDVSSDHSWLAEGLAVYVEPIARVQAGALTEQTIWTDMARDMPKGVPDPGDGGLDDDGSWRRTYWGGALFCLEADIGIRKSTDNRLGLQDAMRGVLAAGGNHEVSWPIRRILSVADAAVGGTVMTALYEKRRASDEAPDLNAMLTALGVVPVAGAPVRFDDSAPLAAIRKAIVRKPSTPG